MFMLCLVLEKVDSVFLKIINIYCLLVCRVGMWETRRVFHISTRFSFFASFFLFKKSVFFVDNYPLMIASIFNLYLKLLFHLRRIIPVLLCARAWVSISMLLCGLK